MKSWEHHFAAVLGLLRLDSIRRKIVVLALASTLIPAVSTAVLSYVQNRRGLTDTLEGELRGLGSQAARELDLWVKERSYDVRVFVSSFEVSENLDRLPRGGPGAEDALTRLNNYLTGVQGRFRDYAELLVLDVDERSVASSRSQLRDAVVPEGWRSRLRAGETILGEPYFDEAIGSVAVSLAQPIEAADTRFLGVLMATLTFEVVDEVLAGLAPGVGGRVDLVTGDGRAIASSTADPRLQLVLAASVLDELADASGGTHEYVGRDGQTVLGTLTTVPRLDWGVVTELPTREAYAQVAELRNSTLVLVMLLLILVGLVAYSVGLYIVRPLDRLTAGAGSVASGDLSVDLPVTSGGEVGYLTEVFNAMVGKLRTSREELDDANAALREHNVELERLSMTDGLTGLYNRRYVMNELEKERDRSGRHARSFSVLMMDVDRFKNYNDSHGHQAGDQVLIGMGTVIEDATREHDVAARYGGEEFIVLLPDCDLTGALATAERIRSRLAEEVFSGGAVTCSIGAAEFPIHGDAVAEVIAAADAALYRAKDGGRDRVLPATAPNGEPPGAGTGSSPAMASAAPGETPTRRTPSAKAAAVKEKVEAKKSAAAKGAAAKKAVAVKSGAAKKAGKKKKASAKKKTSTKEASPKKRAAIEEPGSGESTDGAAAESKAPRKRASRKGPSTKKK